MWEENGEQQQKIESETVDRERSERKVRKENMKTQVTITMANLTRDVYVHACACTCACIY